jgi:threonine 3-dehydrogenase
MGADHVIDARTDVQGQVEQLTGGRGVDVLLEMSGNATAISQGLQALRPGGEAAILGLPSKSITLDWGNLVVMKGVVVRGIYGRRIWQTWHRMRGLLSSGAVDLAPLITHRLPLDAFEDGFAVMREGTGGKVILSPGSAESPER